MFTYLVRRVIAAAVTMILVVLTVFVIFVVVPGGPGRPAYGEGGISPVAVFLAGKRAQNRSYLRSLSDELGFGKPLVEQFGLYLRNLSRGDFGTDFRFGVPVRDRIFSSIPVSLGLMVGASAIWLVIAIGTGAYAARRRGSPADRKMSGAASVLMSVPVFVSGLVFLLLLVPRGWYRLSSYVPISEDLSGYLQAMWLPWLVLAAAYVGAYFRLVRGNMLDAAHEDFIRTAEAQGLSELSVTRYQLRYAIAPVMSLYSADIAVLAGNLIIVEKILDLPGLGALLADSINSYELNVIAGVALVGSLFVVTVSTLVDVGYAIIDPRLRGRRH